MINDGPNVAPNYTYGKKTYVSDHVEEVIKA